MKTNFSRRDFLATSTALAAGLGFGLPAPGRARAAEPGFKTKLHKALIVGKPAEDELKRFKDAGFDGVEAGILPPPEAEACRKVAEQCGMRIHSVLRGWAEFNSDDPAKVEKTFAVTEDALRAAQAYGADTVLLVPCRISGMKMPAPRQFAIEFDPKTGHLTRAVAGDNAPYADYLKAHNRAIVLQVLAERPGWVFTRQQILDGVHGDNYAITDRAVDVQIVGLRKKLGRAGKYIETVRGVGYRFKE